MIRRFSALAIVAALAVGWFAVGQASGSGTSSEAGRVIALAPRANGGYKLTYRSIGVSGDPVDETAVLWFPTGARSGDVVAWAHQTTGLADACAPSSHDTFTITGLDALRANGHIVVAPDYEGLGTRGVHPYLVGDSEGRSILDAIRAARFVGNVNGRSAVYGWSQGGHAALFAARLAPKYAPDVRLSGAVAIAPVTSMVAAVDRSTYLSRIPGVVAMIAAGYVTAYPKLHADELLGNPTRDISTATSRCDVADALKDATSSLPEGPWLKALQANDASNAELKVPAMIVHGNQDNLLPASDSTEAYHDLCNRGSIVRLRLYELENHMTVPDAAAPYFVRWMEDRLRGEKLTGCSQHTVV